MYNSLIDIPLEVSKKYPDRVSHRFLINKAKVDKTYSEFVSDFQALTLGFNHIGVNEGDHLSLFVNNRYEWSVTDFSLQSLGAVSVPRGSDTSPKEAKFIYEHSDSTYLILEYGRQLNDLEDIVKLTKKVFIINDFDIPQKYKSKVILYKELFKIGKGLCQNSNLYPSLLSRVDFKSIVSIIYTSGTTGNPKGVVLNQGQFVENVLMTAPRMEINESIGEVSVVILPSWHVFERTF